LADNATLNQTRIERLAKMLISEEQSGIKIAQDLKADYIAVYVVGQIRFYGKVNNTASNSTIPDIPIYTLGQGGDESKKQWFMRIGEFDENRYIEQDGFTPTPEFWDSTLLGKLFPFQPAYYASFGPGGEFSRIEDQWQQGLTGLYEQHIKYPADGGANQPLHLVYSSPSFNEKRSIMFGVFIYKVNHDYVPKPQGDPYAKPGPVQTTGPDMTTSNEVAVIETTQGTIKLEFFPAAAPKHVENFMELAGKGFYDGTVFHRIVPGFVIQGGDPNTVNSTDRNIWGQGGPGYTIEEEFNDIPHDRGILSMARASDPDSAGSQFFIVLIGDEQTKNALDKQYTVFGRVIEGMDVVDKISRLQTIGGSGTDSTQPINYEQARILSVQILESSQ